MSKAAIMGSLIDAKNVASDKSIRLLIDVPVEHADQIYSAFGWPSRVNPVPVAIARLVEPKPQPAPVEGKRKWEEMPPSQQAALRCGQPEFQKFMGQRLGDTEMSEEKAAFGVRDYCAVTSRAVLNIDKWAAKRWQKLDDEFFKWSRGLR